MSNGEHVYQIGDGTKELVVRHGQAPNIFQYNGFQYAVDTTTSFINSVLKLANKDTAVVAYQKEELRVFAVLDANVQDRPQDGISLQFKISRELKSWLSVCDARIDQKALVKFLEVQKASGLDVDLLIGSLKQLKFMTQTTGDYSFDDNNNYTFSFKVGDAEGIAKIPAQIVVKLPILMDGTLVTDVTFEIEFLKPKAENEKPGFVITCPLLQAIKDQAVDEELSEIHKHLDGFLIVAGKLR